MSIWMIRGISAIAENGIIKVMARPTKTFNNETNKPCDAETHGKDESKLNAPILMEKGTV